MATWNSKNAADAQITSVSTSPLHRQERAHFGAPTVRLFLSFRNRTVADADEHSQVAYLLVPGGVAF
ncbi:hypothetical protein HPB50_021707 [Hyalomma asiaticum]|uniref:Uncharacterized protein n=1 Tax=Hyalomma asiaticum TaxID=266040 RepID=A0ACB7RWJ6_HYAAI|nr:hypothetical protein HPB50_021707 [Hyalomma asiaticum]